MFNSTILDVAIGLIFTFLAFSLAVSAIVEAIASIIKLRSATLLEGVKDLLNDHKFSGLALSLYNHALVNPREPGIDVSLPAVNQAAKSSGGLASWLKRISFLKIWIENRTRKLPAYINSNQFAAAMVDVLKLAGRDSAGMKVAIDSNPMIENDVQIKTLLNGIVDRTEGKLQDVQKELAGWFDNAMDRVSGVYKRRTQFWGFIIAILMAGLLNVSAINIGQTLWVRPIVTNAIAGFKIDLGSQDNVATQLNNLNKLGMPVGWTGDGFHRFFCEGWDAGHIDFRFTLVAGWLVTAIATLFGAPFWFDSLQQIIRLKGAGPSPAEKKSDTAAAG